jgi:hypothetical protein
MTTGKFLAVRLKSNFNTLPSSFLKMSDTTTTRLEEERTKCLLRLSTQSTDKCRHRTFFELASCEARLGHVEEAITALREAMACGLDTVYVDELSTSQTFGALPISSCLSRVARHPRRMHRYHFALFLYLR